MSGSISRVTEDIINFVIDQLPFLRKIHVKKVFNLEKEVVITGVIGKYRSYASRGITNRT